MLQEAPDINYSAASNAASMFSSCGRLTEANLTSAPTNASSLNNMFFSCHSLVKVTMPAGAWAATNISGLFRSCYALEEVTAVNAPSAITTLDIFWACYSLKTVGDVTLTSATNIQRIFQDCQSLEVAPTITTSASLTSCSSAFTNCYALKEISVFDTSNVTNISSMFQSCFEIRELPAFDFSSVTTAGSAFSSMNNLYSVPPLIFGDVNLDNTFSSSRVVESLNITANSITSASNTFGACQELKEITLTVLNPSTAIASSMFTSCNALRKLNTNAFENFTPTNISSMFNGCYDLTSVGPLDCSSVTSASNPFINAQNLSTIVLDPPPNISFSVSHTSLNSAALDELYTALPVVGSATITVTNALGVSGDDPSIATGKGWTVSG
jgi:surface protein